MTDKLTPEEELIEKFDCVLFSDDEENTSGKACAKIAIEYATLTAQQAWEQGARNTLKDVIAYLNNTEHHIKSRMSEGNIVVLSAFGKMLQELPLPPFPGTTSLPDTEKKEAIEFAGYINKNYLPELFSDDIYFDRKTGEHMTAESIYQKFKQHNP